MYKLIFIIVTVASCRNYTPYILPEADFRPEATSNPCIVGKILEGNNNYYLINNSKNNQSTKIYLSKSSKIFTEYGGHLFPNQIKVGSVGQVWFEGKSCKKPALPLTAARLMVDVKAIPSYSK